MKYIVIDGFNNKYEFSTLNEAHKLIEVIKEENFKEDVILKVE